MCLSWFPSDRRKGLSGRLDASHESKVVVMCCPEESREPRWAVVTLPSRYIGRSTPHRSEACCRYLSEAVLAVETTPSGDWKKMASPARLLLTGRAVGDDLRGRSADEVEFRGARVTERHEAAAAAPPSGSCGIGRTEALFARGDR